MKRQVWAALSPRTGQFSMSINLSPHCNSPELNLSSQFFPQQQLIASFIFKLLLLKCKDFLHIQQKICFFCVPFHFISLHRTSSLPYWQILPGSWLFTLGLLKPIEILSWRPRTNFIKSKIFLKFHPLCCLTLFSLKYFCFLVGILVSFSFEFPCSLLSFMFVFFQKRFLIFFCLKPLYCTIDYIILYIL